MTEFKDQLDEECLKFAVLGASTTTVGALAIAAVEQTPIHEVPLSHVGGLTAGIAVMGVGIFAAGHAIRMHWHADRQS